MSIALAMVLDALLGEPKWLWNRVPHPAVVMGKAIGRLDAALNNQTRWAGVLTVFVLIIGSILIGVLLAALPGSVAEILVGGVLLAQRSLVQHVQAVADGLRLSDSAGRSAVAMIVGRDVTDMDSPAIARAAVESAAENFSDGVIAPLFWFVVLGLPGLIVYKAVNTADSMIGYRTERYENFGWAAARLDDVLNWIPARLSAMLIWAVSPQRATWAQLRADASLHRSPNAGWPEAAMAPALGIALSGPRSYDGTLQEFPWVHAAGRKAASPGDIDHAVQILWKAWGVAAALIVVIALL